MTGLICCTLECNLSCSYCFEGNGNKKKCPDLKYINELFTNAIPQIDQFIDELYFHNGSKVTTIIWHGGEPTLIRPELMSAVMDSQRRKGHDIHWAIQTNGTIIGDAQIEMFKEYKVSVGISLDGIRDSHDAYRVTKSGKPTFDLIFSNIYKLKDSGITPNILLTINDKNVGELTEIYRFLAVENKLHISFNALYPNSHKNEVALNSKDYADSICALFDEWIEDEENHTMLLPFVRIMEGLMYPRYGIHTCHWRKDCSNTMVAIDTNGDLFNCEHWVDKKEFCLGNIANGLEQCLANNTRFKDRAANLRMSDCRNCEIYNLCFGGCPSNAYEMFGSTDRCDKSICEGRKLLIRHIYEYMKEKEISDLPNYSVYGGANE